MNLFFLFLINNITAYNLPPINTIYNKNIYIPLIGSQLIETKMISPYKAKIKLTGIINTNGLAYYYLQDNKINIKLSKELSKLMEQLNCDFSEPDYNYKKDEIIFKLFIKKIYFNKKIILTKQKS